MRTLNPGDEYNYTVDGRTNRFKVVECTEGFDGERVLSVRWIESRQSWTKAITSHSVKNIMQESK
jgi:hypothetical protein